ncbi:unnamed protein product [Adineta steineri]|uniref:UBX domain-containing protein n=1 Tax=Adineta steineri TaxID=433720 RepID=A0A813RI43_9BILA|nr:unnamed protein product [Adineta steineri]
MSSESREQILADFQDCTGLENMEECISFLEQYQWNLLNAVQAVHDRIGSRNDTNNKSTVPKRSTTTTTTSSSHRSIVSQPSSIVKKPIQTNSNSKHRSDSDEHDDSDEPRITKILPGVSKTTKGASGITTRARDKLRLKIDEKLHVPPSQQKFSNWAIKHTDQTILKDLRLPQDNTIHLISTASSITNGATRSSSSSTTAATTTNRSHYHPVSPSKISPTKTSDFPVTVSYEDKSGKKHLYELVLKKTSTVADMKKEIEHVAHIPVRQQSWNGLCGARDPEELHHTSIKPKSQLVVRKIESSSSSSSKQLTPTVRRETKQPVANRYGSEDEPMDIDPEIDLEHYDDDNTTVPPFLSSTTTPTSISSNRELLIPDRCTDDVKGLEHFTRVFHARYGSTGPILYIGSLDQAIQDSVCASREERRPLAIYLHNDRSVCANVFCAQVLAGETTIEYLANNYVVWAWDVTSDANRTRLLEVFKRCLGQSYAQRIYGMEKDSFPLLLIVIRSRGSLELINLIEGKSTPSEVLLQLIQSHDTFEQQRQRDADDEIMREKRENLKKEQEDEYHQSLRADLAKEQARLDDERRQKEEQNASEKLKQERLREQQVCKARLPEEPSETEKNTTRLKIRLPDDEGILMRRFRINDTLQILFDYLTSQGRMSGEYKLLSTYPKRDLTTLNRSDTFEQLKLYPQEQLILENL